MTQRRLPRLSLDRADDTICGSVQPGVRGSLRLLAVPALVLGVLAALWAWSNLGSLLGSVVMVLVKSAAVLILVLWAAWSLSGFVSQYRSGPKFPGIFFRPLTAGVFRQPSLTLLWTLGLILIGIVSSVFIVLAVVGATIAGIVLIQLTARVGVTAVRWRQQRWAVHGPDVRTVKAPPPRARSARAPETLLPVRVAARRIDPPGQNAEVPVELLLVVSLPGHADPLAAARMAIHAVGLIPPACGLPSPSCQHRSAANGRTLLELRFYVGDVRRGREHVLNEAKARIWDEFHAQGIAFAFVINQPPADEVAVA